MMYSVIIPHHNSQASLIRCIKSIPDNGRYQIIVVDDCSDPDKVNFDTVRLECGRDFELIIQNKNRGAGAARTEGLKHAKGKWLIFADADDYFLPDMDALLQDATKESAEDIIFFNIDAANNHSVQGKNYQKYVDDCDGSSDRIKNLKYRSWAPWAKLFRRNFVERYKLYFEPRKKGNDCFFVLNAMVKSRHIKVVNEPLYHLTYSPQSLSHTNQTKWEYMYDVYDLWLWRYRFFRDNDIDLWKEYNILYLLKEVKSVFGFRKCMHMLVHSFRYRYNIFELLLSKLLK